MTWPTLRRDVRKHTNSWMLISVVGVALLLLPIALIPVSLFHGPNENWAHIKQYLLKDYLLNSLWLLLFTGFFMVITATGLAWLVAAHDFPLRGFFRWALLLPLTIPPYIAAYTYSNMFSYTGIVQKSLRSAFGITPNPRWFGVMSLRGAIFIFTLFLFPYLYLMIRSFLEHQSASYVENARVLGRGPWAIFVHVILPLAWPGIVAGLTLAAFEVLSDYGVTSYYGVGTISTAIFQAWFGMYDVESAIRLAALLMVGVLSLLVVERIVRSNRRFSSSTTQSRPYVLRPLRGIHAAGAAIACGVIFAFAFLIPFLQLLLWASWTYAEVLNAAFAQMLARTLYLALLATAVIMLLATIVANVHRTANNALSYALSRSVTAGYAVPGAIVAIGVLAFFIGLDHLLAPLYARVGLGDTPLVLSMSLTMLLVAYVVRYMATGYSAVESGFTSIGTLYADVARTLGYGMTKSFFKVDLPLLRGAILSGTLLTFVEIVKELPLGLLLRPFNFETLATIAYAYANDEMIQQSAVPALLIMGISTAGVYVLHQLGKEPSR